MKTERKKLIKALDTEVSLFVRRRDKKCFTCGAIENLQCGHLFTRSAYSTRWNLINCNTQCNKCNLRHEYNPHIYTTAFIDCFGLKAYKKLFREHAMVKKWTNGQLRELLEEIKKL